MNLKQKIVTLLLGLSVCFTLLNAQSAGVEDSSEKGLRLGVGISYRNFNKAGFRYRSIGGGSFIGGWNQDGSLKFESTAAPGDDDILSPSVPFNYYKVDNASWSAGTRNGKYDFNDKLAPIVSASYPVLIQDDFTMSLAANFQFNMASAKESSRQSVSLTAKEMVLFMGSHNESDEGLNKVHTLRSNGKYKFDMDLSTLDLGLRFDYAVLEQLEIFLAAGPSLSYADMDSSYKGSLAGYNSFRYSSNSSEWVFGYYAATGAAFWFNEQIGASLEARYDHGFRDAETRLVTQSLDTWGAAIKLLYQF